MNVEMLVGLIIVTSLIIATPVIAEEITACTVIDKSGVYYLANDISGSATCINITASDVVLDGKGHVVAGNGNGYGIYAENVENVTVRNVSLLNWSYGVYLEVNGGEVENVNVANSAVDGIYISGSDYVVIKGVVSDSNRGTGIVVHTSDNITMEDAVARNNEGSGVLLRSTSNSTLRNVTAVYNDYYGIWLDNARNNLLDGINASYNLKKEGVSEGQIYIKSSNSNMIFNATITASRGRGIYICDSSFNMIANNTITTLGDGVMIILSSDSNTVTNNTILSSGGYGIYITSSHNTISGNSITTSGDHGYGIYVYSYSNYNSVIDNTITTSGDYGHGIHIDYYSKSNTIRNNTITVSGDLAVGILVQDHSDSTSIINNTIDVTGNSGQGIAIYYFSDSTITGNSITVSGNNGYGIIIWASSNNFADNVITASGNNSCGIYIDANSNKFTNDTITANYCGVNVTRSGNTFTNITFNSTYPTKVSFTHYGNFVIKAVNNPPQPPLGWVGIGKYLNITGTGAWIFVNFSYDESDVTNEKTLKVFKYNSTWYEDGWNGTRVLDTDNNVVGVNITDVGSIFAPMEIDVTPPRITINSPQNIIYTTSTIYINVTATDPSGIAEVRAEIDGVTNVTLTKQDGYYVGSVDLEEGSHMIRIFAIDNVGNVNSVIVSFTIVAVKVPAESVYSLILLIALVIIVGVYSRE